MESKRLLLAIVGSILIIIIWRHVSEIIWPLPPQDQGSMVPGLVLPVPSDGQGSQIPAGEKQGPGKSVAAGGTDVPVDPQALYAQAAEKRDDNIPLGNSQVGNGYKMRLMLTNRGAGIV